MSKNSEKRLVFLLTGGLGNQLFQLAAALYFGNSEIIYFDWKIARPRLNLALMPELTSFQIPGNVELLPGKKWAKLVSKSSGYILRMGIAPRRYEKNKLVRRLIHLTANVIATTYFGTRRQALSPIGVGYSDFKIPSGNVLVSGYFQSFKWASDSRIIKILKALQIRHVGPQLSEYKGLALNEKPLVVHIRLGDYKLEDDFGILSKDYYVQSIKSIDKNFYRKIWVFSDEPELAIEFVPKDLHNEVRWIPEIDDSASSTLELMRSGSAYVIGNSTFSWWGAFLSYSENPLVIAPKPWFKNMESPIDLVPPNWQVRPGW